VRANAKKTVLLQLLILRYVLRLHGGEWRCTVLFVPPGEAPESLEVVERKVKRPGKRAETPRKDKEVKCAINNHREQQPSGCS